MPRGTKRIDEKKVGYAILLIFTHHRFSDALVETQILIDLSGILHLCTPFCKRFSMDYGGFPLAARGMERKHGGRRFEG